jgi:hypothetical protein
VSGFRAVTAAAFTAALAVAGHALAGGGWPTGAAAALLTAVAVTTGLVADGRTRLSLVGILAVGQMGAHLALAAAGHVHQTPSASWQLMLAAHTAAVLVGAALMTVAQRSAEVLSRVVRRCAAAPQVPAHPPRVPRIPRNPQPRQHVRLLAASLSHRGPPAGVY